MGHDRIGFVPRTVKWQRVLSDINGYSVGVVDAGSVGRRVLENVRNRFDNIADDKGVNAAFTFLVAMAYSAKRGTAEVDWMKRGIELPVEATEFQVAKHISRSVERNLESREYGEIAKASAIDTVATWYKKYREEGEDIFGARKGPKEIWQQASDGSGFCEMSRIFLSKFTERYLNYFIEREAGAHLSDWDQIGRLREDLAANIDTLSKYAFETTKITQSFAAGWYNKNTREGLPSSRQIRGFLLTAFEKLREEFAREKASN